MKIAIISAGNLGQAMAADLALKGQTVSLWNRTASKLEKIQDQGGIYIEGVIEGFGELDIVSSDFEEVIKGRDLIMVTSPASGHLDVGEALGPLVTPDQLIMLHPGHTFGAIEVASIIRKHQPGKCFIIGEIQTSLLTSRAVEMGKVYVSAVKKNVPTAVFPGKERARLKPLLELYPSLVEVENVYKTGFDNLNASFHPTLSLLNLTKIEKGEEFYFYMDGITPAGGRFVAAVDAERCAVAKALGVEPIPAFDWIKYAYDVHGDDIYSRVQSNKAYAKITAPKSLETRLFLEDIPTGLIPIASVGKALDVPTPAINAIITIASIIYDYDFRLAGRSLKRLGLDGLSAEDLRTLAEEGFPN